MTSCSYTLLATLLAVFLVSGCESEEPGADAPEVHLSASITGEFSASYVFDVVHSYTSYNDPDDCADVRRGVAASSEGGRFFVEVGVDGCTQLSEGAPPLIIPGQVSVTYDGESYGSAYYDGAQERLVDGCLITFAEVSRWEASPFHDDHLFVTGTYTCEPLHASGDFDRQVVIAPGTFTFDWTSSAP